MSNALTPDAPVDSPAVPSVEDPAPASEAAVTSGSAGESAYVEAARFNGLMSAHQKTLNANAELAMQVADLQARLAQQEEVTDVVMDDDLREEIASLREDLARERTANARKAALDKYPTAKPFADLIVGDTAEELEQVAAAIAQRMAGIVPEVPAAEANEQPAPEGAPAAEAEPASEAPAATVVPPPVVAGGSAPPADGSAADRVTEALRSQDWNAYLEAKLSTAGQLS